MIENIWKPNGGSQIIDFDNAGSYWDCFGKIIMDYISLLSFRDTSFTYSWYMGRVHSCVFINQEEDIGDQPRNFEIVLVIPEEQTVL